MTEDKFPNGVTILAVGNILRNYFPDIDPTEVLKCEHVLIEQAEMNRRPLWLEIIQLLRDLERHLSVWAFALGENGHLAIPKNRINLGFKWADLAGTEKEWLEDDPERLWQMNIKPALLAMRANSRKPRVTDRT